MNTVFDGNPSGAERVGRAARRRNLKAEFGQPLRQRHRHKFVAIVDREEHAALIRQRRARAQLRLGERLAEILAHAHHFAGGAHLRTQRRIDAGELIEWEHRRFHEELRDGEDAGGAREIRNLLSQHYAQPRS